MSSLPRPKRPSGPFALTRSHRGFTLVELMISMVLGLLIIGSATAVFLSNKESYRSNEALGQVQENVRIAFELMARDIRQAALTGCGNVGRVGNVLNNGPIRSAANIPPTTPAWFANFDNAIRGYEGDVADPAVTTGTSSAQRVAGTDSIAVIGAAETGFSLSAHTIATNTLALNETGTGLVAGDIIVICDPDHAAIMQISGLSSGTPVAGTGTTTPGNCSRGLGFPTTCANAAGNGYQFAANSHVARLVAADWYIGTNPQGTRSLYRMTPVVTAGTPTPTAQEMVRDVTDLQITYLLAGGTAFVDATTVGAANWANVDAVRLAMTLQSTDQRAGTGATPITRQLVTTVALRNRVN